MCIPSCNIVSQPLKLKHLILLVMYNWLNTFTLKLIANTVLPSPLWEEFVTQFVTKVMQSIISIASVL